MRWLLKEGVSRSRLGPTVVKTAVGGCALVFWLPQEHDQLTIVAWFLAGAVAMVFVALWLYIGDLVALFQSP